MVKYDWLALRHLNSEAIIGILLFLKYNNKIVEVPRSILKIISTFEHNISFMLNVESLANASHKYTNSELYIYLELASLRSYIEYKQTGKLSLPTYYLPEQYNLDRIKMNRALKVIEDEIFFKYEENV